jgi:hypothetical protein
VAVGALAALAVVVGGALLLGGGDDESVSGEGAVAGPATSDPVGATTVVGTAAAPTTKSTPTTLADASTSTVPTDEGAVAGPLTVDPAAATTVVGAAAAPTTGSTPTTLADASTSTVPTGPFVRITDVFVDYGAYVATYEVTGYVPLVDGGPDSLHIHLYLNDIDPENAGTTGPSPGTWDITDAPTSFRTSVSPADAAARGATQLCALVATVDHGVYDPDSGTCFDLPR